mmetsp:Transcript_28670/g.54920  ORF Transcript_28670/g.54920 Transcript_28670/m.54920 type:complete len:437 (-) Transcript_28670:149-1459(-)
MQMHLVSVRLRPRLGPSASRARPVCAILGGLEGLAKRVQSKRRTALLPAVKNTPHPEKVAKGGEDAWMVSVDEQGGALAVADGVGGYDEYGVDSGLYSKQFMEYASMKNLDQGNMEYDPSEVIAHAHKLTLLPGACTACVLQLDGSNSTLYGANVGDSGFLVIRDGELVFESPSMQHYFDCPFQLCNPEFAPSDSADDAMSFELEVKEGDVIVAGSDGLFDNVFCSDIVQLVSSSLKNSMEDGASPFLANLSAAEGLSTLASVNAADEQYESPYAKQCTSEQSRQLDRQVDRQLERLPGPLASVMGGLAGAALGPLECVLGGKTDDITVVVATVVDAERCAAELQLAEEANETLLGPVRQQLEQGLKIYNAKEDAKKAPAKKKVPAARTEDSYTRADIELMDKNTLRTLLASYGLPTSGKITVLQDRLAEVLAGSK